MKSSIANRVASVLLVSAFIACTCPGVTAAPADTSVTTLTRPADTSVTTPTRPADSSVVASGRGHVKNMMMSPYMLIPQLISLGFAPIVLANLKMMVMSALMVNNMAFNAALFMTVRNMVFGPRPGGTIKYVNHGYQNPSNDHHDVYDHHGGDVVDHGAHHHANRRRSQSLVPSLSQQQQQRTIRRKTMT